MDNHKIAQILLKIQMDDLNDARMLAEYAHEIADAGDAAVSAAVASRAKARLSQMHECTHSVRNVISRMESEGNMPDVYASLYKTHVEHEGEAIRKLIEVI